MPFLRSSYLYGGVLLALVAFIAFLVDHTFGSKVLHRMRLFAVKTLEHIAFVIFGVLLLVLCVLAIPVYGGLAIYRLARWSLQTLREKILRSWDGKRHLVPQVAGLAVLIIALILYGPGVKSTKEFLNGIPWLAILVVVIAIALIVAFWRLARSREESDWRGTVRDVYQKVSGGGGRWKTAWSILLSIIFVHILLALMLGSTYVSWWSNPAFVRLNLLIIPALGLTAVLLGEGLVFWGGFIGAGIWFTYNMSNSDITASENAQGGNAQSAVSNVSAVSAGVPFQGSAVDHFSGPETEFLRERFEDYPELADICAAESTAQHWADDEKTVVLRYDNANGTYDLGLCQINSVHLVKADSLGLDVKTMEGNVAFAEWLYLKEGTTPWNASACRWRDKYDPCPENGRGQVFAISEVFDSIVTLPADGSFQGPIVVGDPRVFTYNLVPSRTVRFVFRYPNGREKEFVDGVGRSNATGAVPSFHLRVTDGEEVTWKFSRIRLN